MNALADIAPVAAKPVAAKPAGAEAAAPAAVERAQALRCGDLSVALPHGWARAAIEQVELSAVPGAPPWLAGAANVEGRIVPVIDLAAWAQPGRFIDATAKDARLLVGGTGEDSVALLFQGIPRLVRFKRHPAVAEGSKLSTYAIGSAEDDPDSIALDMPALVEALITELALQ